jgi:hypothetical protein
MINLNLYWIVYGQQHILSFNCFVFRYRIEVQAIHKDVKARFLLWDNEVTSIVGISAADLKEEMIEVNNVYAILKLNRTTDLTLLERPICS